MVVDRGRIGIVVVMTAVAMVSLSLISTSAHADAAGDAAPVPVSLLVPQGEPWPGFRPDPDGGRSDDTFPMSRIADPRRWQWWDAGIAGTIALPPARSFGPPTPAPVGPRFSRESDEFRQIFAQALSAAGENRVPECLALIEAAAPRTLEGSTALRELEFAARVAAGGRSFADSLFYRMSWNDQGRAASRLAAWRAFDSGDFSSAERILAALPLRTPGEELARAMASWGANAEESADLSGVVPASPTEAAAASLLRARNALREGRPGAVVSALQEVPEADVPTSWRDARVALRRAGGGGEESRPGTPDAEAYEEAVSYYLRGEDRAARDRLETWLTRWLDSPYRDRAYLVRAELNLAERALDQAEADLRVAETRGGFEVRERARLARAFLLGAQGNHAQARGILDEILASPRGAREEPELLFNRARLERQERNDGALASTLRLLEEGYGDTGWYRRALGDVTATDWRTPYRRLPPPPARSARVEAPREGPWHRLLWGEDVLVRTATALEVPVATPVVAAVPRPDPPSPATETSSAWRGALALGGGSRRTGFVEGGLSGNWRGIGLRMRADGLRTDEPSDLPTARVGGLEFGASGAASAWRWSLVGEARGRRLGELESAEGPLRDGAGPVDADWWGSRLDVRREDAGARITRVQVATLGGDITVDGRGRWMSRQQWLRIEARQTEVGADWQADFDLARFDLLQPDAWRKRFLFPDLRVVRRFPGGFHLGARAAMYRSQGLVLPVAGVERRLADGLEAWAATEPGLDLTSFRETFLETGDWNVPDFELPAQRRSVDLRAGIRYRTESTLETAVRWQYFIADAYRTWREDGGFWIETAQNDVEATRLHGEVTLRPEEELSLTLEVDRWWTRANGAAVAYVPTRRASLEFAYRAGPLTVGTRFLGVRGRHDAEGRDFGSFLRWDVEAAYRARRSLEYSLRIENLTGDDDRRWPGLPAYGRGVFAGLRYRLGS